MRWAALTFVVGLALGYLFGSAGGDTSAGRADRSETKPVAEVERLPVELHREGALGEGPAVQGDPELTQDPSSDPPRSVPVAESDPDLPHGFGKLVVDISGLSQWMEGTFCLVETGMRGQTDEVELEKIDDRHYGIQARAGVHTLQWYGAREWRVGVEIRAGEVRYLNLTENSAEHLPPPIPAGFGRLTVRLLGVDRKPVPNVTIHILGNGVVADEVETVEIQSDGLESTHVRPGQYEVRAGGAVRAVAVSAGKETRCSLDHSQLGEIHLPNKFPGKLELTRPASMKPTVPFFSHSWDWGRRRVVFVTPGIYSYRLLLAGQRGKGWPAGEVQVTAGRVTRVDPPIPTGSLVLEATLDPTPALLEQKQLSAYLKFGSDEDRVYVTLMLRAVPDRVGVYRGERKMLPPGDWTLSVEPASYEPHVQSVTIGTQRVRVRVALKRTR